jgi:hypothetical protein
MRTESPLIVSVERNPRGGWDIEFPEQHTRVRCETLDDAKRVAFLSAAHSRACTVVVRDAYHRVLDEVFVSGDQDLAAPAAPKGRRRLTIRRRERLVLLAVTMVGNQAASVIGASWEDWLSRRSRSSSRSRRVKFQANGSAIWL